MDFFVDDEAIQKEEELTRINHSLWVEKYRPVSLENYIGNEHIKKKIEMYLSQNDIPHLLFYGKAGTGKTTLAKLIVNNIDCDTIYINASDENSVDTVRSKIKTFASSVGIRGIKIIILDEFDYMTANAQAALRNLMETFSEHSRFILTCNYKEKIIDPIVSRCQTFAVTPPSRKEVAIHLSKILDGEGVDYNTEDIALIINKNYPDIRRCINNAQMQSSDGVLEIDKQSIVESDYKLKLLELLKKANTSRAKDTFNEIRKLVANNNIRDFTDCYRFLYDNIDEFAVGNVGQVILVLADAQESDALVVDKEINFMSAIIKILTHLGG